MGLRFRKRVKILPGVHITIGLRSVGVSLGTRWLRFSFNTKGRQTTTLTLPGSGFSYQKSWMPWRANPRRLRATGRRSQHLCRPRRQERTFESESSVVQPRLPGAGGREAT
jgi:hypothetical protein